MTTLPTELCTLDLSIVGSNPMFDTVLRTSFSFLEYNILKLLSKVAKALVGVDDQYN